MTDSISVGAPASIVITSHNYGPFLSKTIESALAQTYEPVEVIVVDDGSTDDSREIIAAFGDRIIPVLKENGGQASAFNSGFQASRGDVICFVDSDDLILPRALEESMPLFADPRTIKVHWPLQIIDEAGKKTGEVMHRNDLAEGDLRDTLIERGPAGYNWPSTSGNLWSRRLLDRVLPMPEAEYRIGPDAYLSAFAPLFGSIGRVAEPQGCYRIHGRNNTVRQPFPERLHSAVSFWNHCFDKLEQHCRHIGLEVDRRQWEKHSFWHQTDAAVRELMEVIPAGKSLIVAGADEWALGGALGDHPVRPFPERDGLYWGPPGTDTAALAELERALSGAVEYLVLPWWCIDWLDHYPGMQKRLRREFLCILQNDRLIVFNLRARRAQSEAV